MLRMGKPMEVEAASRLARTDLVLLGHALEDGVQPVAGHRAHAQGAALAHAQGLEALGLDPGGGLVVVVDVHGDDQIGAQLTGQHPAAVAADLLVGGRRAQVADVLEPLALGEQPRELGHHEAAQPVVQVGALEGVGGEAGTDRAIQEDGIAGADAEGLHLLLAVLSVQLQVQVDLLAVHALAPVAHRWIGEVDGAQRLDGAAVDDPVAAGSIGILAEQPHLVAQQGEGQEGVGVDPDLPVRADAAHLHADLVGMADDHHGEGLGPIRRGVHHHRRVAAEAMHLPALGHEGLDGWLQQPVGHGPLEADGAGGGEDLAHARELVLRHRLGPGLVLAAHGDSLPRWRDLRRWSF
jgi:hypothetical protein